MGADLYIMKMERDKQYTGWRTSVDVGYFRDAYNNSNLLWQFDLSYWADIGKKFTTKAGYMSVKKTKELLAELKKREPIFESNLQDMLDKKNKYWDFDTDENPKDAKLTDEQRKEWVDGYRKDYETLKKFLNKAIELDSKIACSI